MKNLKSLLFKSARLIDPSIKMDWTGDLLAKDGVISAVSACIAPSDGDEVINCSGTVLAPGLVDLHVHFRDPGQTQKETLDTGCAAAANGGFTAVCTMANTIPATDTPEAIKKCIERSRTLDCRIYPAGSVTKGLAGKELTDFEALKESGAVCVTDDGLTVGDNVLFYAAMEQSAKVGIPISVHCETHGFEGDRTMNRGAVSSSLGLVGTPALAEEFMIMRDVFFAEKTGAHVHVQHVSSKRGVEIIAEAKRRGVDVTAEGTPHHMFLNEKDVLKYGTNAKMSPPLRLAEDAKAVREAVMSGILDVITTDHAPHTEEEKSRGMEKAPNGIIGLETSLALCLDGLCYRRGFSIYELIDRMSTKPREIFSLPRVSLQPGYAADLVLIDPNYVWTVDVSKFKSKARNCPFDGWKLKGMSVMTVLGGRVTCDRRNSA